MRCTFYRHHHRDSRSGRLRGPAHGDGGELQAGARRVPRSGRPYVEVSTRLPYVYELGDDDARPKHNRIDRTLDLLVNTGMLTGKPPGEPRRHGEPVVYTYTTTEAGEATRREPRGGAADDAGRHRLLLRQSVSGHRGDELHAAIRVSRCDDGPGQLIDHAQRAWV